MMVSLGKWRRLQQATTPRGTFTVLAIDHRGPLRRKLAAALPPEAVDGALAGLKEDIVRALGPGSTAVLLDPEIGVPRCLAQSALTPHVGLLVALDTGSTGDPHVLKTGLVPDWGADDALRVGAAGAKLLVYYHPDAPDAPRVEALVQRVAQACAEAELPFYLEPLAYDHSQPGARLSSRERRRVVIATARRLVPLGVDVLKAEFPVPIAEEPDEAIWREACAELTAACRVPWVLLSGGVPFEDFLRQTRIAGEAGASGVIAGRALWDGAVTVDVAVRQEFLTTVASDRLRRLSQLCDAVARPLTAVHQPASGLRAGRTA
jgi:tagatose 1,6-diphosphate aldolase